MIIPSSIAFLYQLIPKCGTLGGLILKEPLIEMCGNFKCGNDHEKLKKLLILFIALLTMFFAPSKMLLNLFLIAPSTFDTVDFAAFRPLEIVDFTPLITLDTVDLILFQTLVKVDLMLFSILEIVDLIALNTLLITDLIELITLVTVVLIAFQIFVIVV